MGSKTWVGLLLFLLSAESMAAPVSKATAPRKIGGSPAHVFLPSSLVPSPFVRGEVRSTMEAAMAAIDVDGASLRAAGFTPALNAQIAFGRVGVDVSASFSETAGADSYSALVMGANFGTSLGLGLRACVVCTSRFTLTPSLYFAKESGISFSPIHAVGEGLASRADAENARFLRSTTRLEVVPRLLAALSLSQAFGLSCEIAEVLSRDLETGQGFQPQALRTSVALSAGGRGARLPVGFSAGFRHAFALDVVRPSSSLLSLGVFESSRENFNFGVEVTRLLTRGSNFSGIVSLNFAY